MIWYSCVQSFSGISPVKPEGPAGYEKDETNLQKGEESMQASASTSFRKLMKKGT